MRKKIRGKFTLYPDSPEKELEMLAIEIENNILDAGESAFLGMIARGATDLVAIGGDFYVGLCGFSIAETTSLSGLPSEPSGNGYNRIALPRNAVGFPTLDTVGGVARVRSRTMTFSASGGSISAFRRLFLCNASAGTTGQLFAISGALDADTTIADGESLPVEYELYLK